MFLHQLFLSILVYFTAEMETLTLMRMAGGMYDLRILDKIAQNGLKQHYRIKNNMFSSQNVLE
jgi:hypothetical protein